MKDVQSPEPEGERAAGGSSLVVAANSEANPKPLFRNAAEVAADLIREAIYTGRISPGERIKEEQFAEELGISRTPIREALLTLQAEHLLETAPRRGVTVREYTSSDVSDLYDLRALIEGYAAGRAARQRSDEVVNQLRESVNRFALLKTPSGKNLGPGLKLVMDENACFHQLILDATSSPVVKAQVHHVSRLPLSYHSKYWLERTRIDASIEQHRKILEAIEQRDSIRAESLMREHILYARDIVLSNLRSDEAKRTRPKAATR